MLGFKFHSQGVHWSCWGYIIVGFVGFVSFVGSVTSFLGVVCAFDCVGVSLSFTAGVAFVGISISVGANGAICVRTTRFEAG